MRRLALVATVALTSVFMGACTKKDDPDKSSTEKSSTEKAAPKTTTSASAASAPATGDGSSMSSPLSIAMGKPVEGVIACPKTPWFVVVPPMDGKIKYELEIPKGADQFCTHLNARDAAGKLLDSTLSECSDNPDVFSAMEGPFGKDVAFFTIDQNDPAQKCVPARFRLTLVK